MNASNNPIAAPQLASTTPPAGTAVVRAPARSAGEAFERLLSQKAARQAEAAGAPQAPPPEAGTAAPGDELRDARPGDSPAAVDAALAGVPMPVPPVPGWVAPLLPHGAALAGASAAVTASGVAAGLAMAPGGGPVLAADVADAGAWDVTLACTGGSTLDLHAARLGAPGVAPAAPAWALSLSATGPDAAALAQHLPRLNERLRTRTAGASHARIEERTGNSA